MLNTFRRKVAVLDDDDDLVASLAAMLQQQGFDAKTFTDADALCEAARHVQFDAFIVDWLLLDTTAAQAISRLRRRESSSRAPIFLLSGNLAVGGRPTDLELAQAITQFHLLYRAKPYSTLKLVKDVHDALEGDSR